MRVVLSDGREVLIPISWFPRLERATDEQRRNWCRTPAGWGIQWPERPAAAGGPEVTAALTAGQREHCSSRLACAPPAGSGNLCRGGADERS
ncbi:MAG: DUF2442 domain-containing protein [Acidobacteria bacterium]|nr:DUF2442 domain-containing protein [Acidobacteriota bacterium]